MRINAITAKIQQFLDENDLDYTVIVDYDFGYYYETSEIAYTLVLTERFDRLFNQFLEATYTDITAPIFIWSLLHEIGHGETEDDIDIDLLNKYNTYKNNLDPQSDEDTLKYYLTPDEKIATDWAYNYIKNNYNKLVKFWHELYPMIEAYYEEKNH
jgi:hypothetical protein